MKPCPFCGQTTLRARTHFQDLEQRNAHMVLCVTCGSRGPVSARSKSDAMRLWNERQNKPKQFTCVSCGQSE